MMITIPIKQTLTVIAIAITVYLTFELLRPRRMDAWDMLAYPLMAVMLIGLIAIVWLGYFTILYFLNL